MHQEALGTRKIIPVIVFCEYVWIIFDLCVIADPEMNFCEQL